MTLTDWITRKAVQAPAPAPVATAEANSDASYMTAWGLTEAQWLALDNQERVWHRWNITKAPNFKA